MEWNSSYSIGVEHIDEQHKSIIELAKKLKDSIGLADSSELIGQTLIELVNYSKVHFADEEKYMQEIGYPELNNHKNLHRKFNNDIILMLNKLSNDDLISIRQLYAFLQNWLIQHFKIEDGKIGAFVRSGKNNKLVSK